MSRRFNVAVLGATGAVGEAMLAILAERRFPVGTLYPLASSRSAGAFVRFNGEQLRLQDAAHFDFRNVQIGLFSAGATVSEVYAPRAAEAGCIVIDKHEDGGYVTPYETAGEDATYISRIREDATVENGLSMWIVSDNLRKGAALNAVQIAEVLVNRCLIAPKRKAA